MQSCIRVESIKTKEVRFFFFTGKYLTALWKQMELSALSSHL